MKRKKFFLVMLLLLAIVVSLMWFSEWRSFLRPVGSYVILVETTIHDLTKLSKTEQSVPRLGYSVANSRAVRPDRILPDTRHTGCGSPHEKLEHLPPTSLVITSSATERSTFARTLVSALSKAKSVRIFDVAIVFDGSYDAKIGEILSGLQGVRIIINRDRKGRAMARMQGIAATKGEIIVLIEDLSEMNMDWLSPLILRLMESPKSLVTPVYDVVDHLTFQYSSLPELYRVGFDWSLQYRWEGVPFSYQVRPDPTSIFRSPVTTGSVIAMRRDFFTWLGQYDTTTWARDLEDMDLSLRAWLCGGQVEIIPCSRVGIINIKGGELGISPVSFNNYLRSARRIAEIWLDDYKRFFYAVRPSARMQPIADISILRKLKEKLKCRSFKWYLTSIYPQLQPLVSDEVAFGYIRQGANCLDIDPGQLPLVAKLRTCEPGKDSQEWSWRKTGSIVSNGMCLTSDLMNMQRFVVVQFCKDMRNQAWYRHNEKIVHLDTNLCLDGQQGDTGLLIADCIKADLSQAWAITNEAQTELEYFNSDTANL
ncbi:unnamed protein product [Lymnaea stagnalis]|uniref:Polypeptide N-acetylgalactosaminyltransferase n=1 Tax=Lymnaea stagnalis TaxID=6523 RepID=A0AAV2HE53_LYMST